MESVSGWTFERALGEGAFGVVWLARDARGTQVAIKQARGAVSAARRDALRAEARVAARLSHPHVVALYDMGEQDERPHLVMAYARWGALSQWAGRLPWQTLGALIEQLCLGLGHVHAAGLLHLDMKPANALLGAEQGALCAMLSDLGMMALEEGGGTPAYMAPEQRARQRHLLGPWTDLYALGLMTRELITGQRDATRAQLLARLEGVPEAEGLALWLERMTHPQPLARYESSAHALSALRALAPPWHPRPTEAMLPALTWGEPEAALEGSTQAVASALTRAWATHEATRVQFAGLGAGLTALREPPLVGHESARDALWAALRDAQGGPVAVCLSGPEGIGRRRLGRWIQTCAHEQLGARVIAVEERAGEAACVTLGRLVRALCMPHGDAPRGALRGHLSAWLEGAGVAPAIADAMAQEAAGLLREADDGEAMLRPARERLSQVAHLLAVVSQGAPLVMMIHDVGRAPIARGLWEKLRQTHAKALVVMTAAAPDPAIADARDIALSPLDPPEIALLVREVLGVARDVAESLAMQVGGNPRFALGVLREWIARGAFEEGPTGLVLASPQAPPLPQDLSALWRMRLDDALSGALQADRASLWVMALLGDPVPQGLWEAACEGLGVAPAHEALSALERAGWVTRAPGAWRFVSELSRRALRAEAQGAGALARAHEAAARALEARAPERAVEIARCWLGAGQQARAIGALRPLLELGIEAGSAYAMLEVLEGVEAAPAELTTLRARAWYAVGENDRAQAILETLDVTTLEGDGRLLVTALELRMLLALSRGQLPIAREASAQLQSHHAQWGADPGLQFRALVAIGRVAIHTKDYPQAVAKLSQAVALDSPHISPLMRFGASILWGSASFEHGDLEGGYQTLAQAIPIGRELGATGLLGLSINSLGDAALRLGKLEEAERWFREALALCQERYPSASYPRGNLAWLLMLTGRDEEALAQLDAALLGVGPGVRHRAWFYLVQLRPGALACLGRARAWEEAMALWEEGFEAVEVAHDEGARAAERGARAWERQGEFEHARVMWGCAARLWARLKDEARAQAALSHSVRTAGATAAGG